MSRVFQRQGQWWIDFKDAQGVRHRRKVGPNRRIAREVLNGILGNVARRQHLGVIEDSAISFADFADEWWKRIAHTLKPRTQERWSGIIAKHLKPAFPGALRAITSADAERYVGHRVEQGAEPSTINREMTVLKHMLRRAVSWEYLSRNPFLDAQGRPLAGLKPLKEPSGRTRFLNADEIARLLDACTESLSPYLKPFVMAALNSGMRRNEILSLTRRTVDFDNRLVRLEQTKNGEARHVYLNQAAFDALRSLPTPIEPDGSLFPLTPHQATMLFVRAVKRAQLQDFRLHDLRHTFASYQAMAGVAGRGLQALLGHRDARMTMRYSHLSDAWLRAAVDGVVLGTETAPAPELRRNGTYLAPAPQTALSKS
jgi:integrase